MNYPGRPPPEQTNHPVVKDERKPQRRTPWACDECRLRKRKCDGVEPCSPCQRSGLDCSYHFRRPAPPQTQRIQMLEVHLRYVRAFLQDAARKVPPELGIDFEGVLHKISTAAYEPPSPPSGSNGTSTPAFKDLVASPVSASANPYPPDVQEGASQHAFIVGILDLLNGGQLGSTDDISAVTSLFDLPMPALERSRKVALPSRSQAMALVDALFGARHPMLAFLHEHYFRDMVELVYEVNGPDQGVERFLPMLHFAFALGHLFAPGEHRLDGCKHAHREALRHFQAGKILLQPLEMNNLTALQTVLCAVVFLLSTCRVAAAHPLIGIATTLALRLGLHVRAMSLPDEERYMRAKVFATVFHVDLYASIVLGLPSFIHPRKVDMAVFDDMVEEDSPQDDLYSATAIAQLKLLVICKINEETVPTSNGVAKEASFKQHAKEAGARLREWRDDIAPLLKQLRDKPGGASFQYELEMLYNFGFLVLWRPLLHDLCSRLRSPGNRSIEEDSDMTQDDAQFALACIKLASTSFSRSEGSLEYGAVNPGSWPVMYTLFQSVLYLVALLSLDDVAAQLSEIWRPALSGVQLLAACNCGDGCASPALDVLKILTRNLADPYIIDVDDIQASVRPICEGRRGSQPDNAYLPAPGTSHSQPRGQQQRSDDILTLLNAGRMENSTAGSTTSMSRSPS